MPESLWMKLDKKARAGSKARCHLLTHGSAETVAARLTSIVEPFGCVGAADKWMPQGFDHTDEAELDKAERLIPDGICRAALGNWWLTARARTPNRDIASTCTIRGQPGLLLIEAKAHDRELHKEEAGKALVYPISTASRRNHEQIGLCIHEASLALASETQMPWALSRDRNYQLSNRFAWAWKLADLGIPVLLVYLGFLGAEEMRWQGKGADNGEGARNLFALHEDWGRLVRAHSTMLVPSQAWDQEWTVHGRPFIPLIRSINQPWVAEP